MQLREARDTGIEHSRNAVLHGEVYPGLECSVNLLIRQIQGAVQDDARLCGALNDITGHVSVLALIHAEPRDRVRRIVGNAVALEHTGVHPHAVEFRFLNLKFRIRADGIQILIGKGLAQQVLFLQDEAVALFAGILLDKIGHKGQGLLFAVAGKAFAGIRVGKSHGQGHVHVAVKDAGHDELAAKVRYLAFVTSKAGFVAHINKFTVFHHQGRGLGGILVAGVDFCVFNDVISFHNGYFVNLYILLTWKNPRFSK